MGKSMNEAEIAQLLDLANERGKFAIGLNAHLTQDEQNALEELQLTGRIRLIDVTPITYLPGIYRVFFAPEKRVLTS